MLGLDGARLFGELTVSASTSLYNTLVRPHLECAIQACLPNLVADADCLKQFQRLAVRLVKGFRRLPYERRLRWLGLNSLNRHRLRGDLLVAHNVFSRGLDLDPGHFFIPPVQPNLRGHPFKVLQGPSRCLRGRVVKFWNRLPTFIVTIPSVNSVKRQLDPAWVDVFRSPVICQLPALQCYWAAIRNAPQ